MASIKDVAELAGVSLSTASIVVNGKAEERKISKKTQEKVLNAMQSLNYIPNVSAKALRRGEAQSYIVALFWNFDYRGAMMSRFLFGMQKRISETNANVSIVIHPYQTGWLNREQDSFTSGEFHAAIIANADMDDLNFLKNSRFRVPIVLYNRQLEGYCSVNVDDRLLGRMAADHMYQQGYRRPAVIHGTQNFPGASHRDRGFLERMEEYGIQLPENEIIYTGNSLKGGFECGKMLLEQGVESLADCYFCSSDFIALGLLNAWAEAGIVPERIGIIAVGNNDPQFGQYHSPSLTVLNIPIEEMAEECCQFLIDRMYKASEKAISKLFETKLYVRDSTRRIRQ